MYTVLVFRKVHRVTVKRRALRYRNKDLPIIQLDMLINRTERAMPCPGSMHDCPDSCAESETASETKGVGRKF
eukprot:5708906-Prymnesium_polylepis.1